MGSPTTSVGEFEGLIQENNKTFEERFQDIFGQQSATTEEPREQEEEEEEEEFIYDGQDVKLFDEEEDQDPEHSGLIGKDYAAKLDEILRSNQIREETGRGKESSQSENTKSNGQEDLESFIELTESDPGSAQATATTTTEDSNLTTSPPVVIQAQVSIYLSAQDEFILTSRVYMKLDW